MALRTSTEAEAGAAAPAQPPEPELPQVFRGWIQRMRQLAALTIDLVALEARVAALSIITMLMLVVLGALLVASTWLTLLGAACFGLVALGWSWPLALLTVAAANTVLAGLVFIWVWKLSDNLSFGALRELLAPEYYRVDDQGTTQDKSGTGQER